MVESIFPEQSVKISNGTNRRPANSLAVGLTIQGRWSFSKSFAPVALINSGVSAETLRRLACRDSAVFGVASKAAALSFRIAKPMESQ
jgi:hypothetical protein